MEKKEDIIKAFKKIFLFSAMTDEEIMLIVSKMKMKYYAASEIIVQQGDEGGSMYVIKKGRVSINILTSAQQLIKLKELQHGDFFGEISLLTGDKRTATIKALTEVELYELERDDLHEAIKANKEIAKKLEEVLIHRKEEMLKAIEEDTLVMEEEIKEDKKFNILIDKIKKFLFNY